MINLSQKNVRLIKNAQRQLKFFCLTCLKIYQTNKLSEKEIVLKYKNFYYNRVDHLYAFFVQWTPEIYGDEEEITPEKRGFVVIEDDESEDLEMLDEHFGPNSTFAKDWEVTQEYSAYLSISFM